MTVLEEKELVVSATECPAKAQDAPIGKQKMMKNSENLAELQEEASPASMDAQESVVEHRIAFRVRLPAGPSCANKNAASESPKETFVTVSAAESDLIQEIKVHLLDSPLELYGESCFSLAFQAKRLDPFQPLSNVLKQERPDSQDDESPLCLDLILDAYTEKDARVHLTRLFDLLRTGDPTLEGPAPGWKSTRSVFDAVLQRGDEKHPFAEYRDVVGNPSAELPHLLPVVAAEEAKKQQIRCLKRLSLSGWNPVPVQRKMAGDLFYLSVTTLEGANYEITASAHGFFVSESSESVFQPTPSSLPGTFAHSFVVLMEQLSKQFSVHYKELMARLSTPQTNFATLPVSPPVFPWLVPKLSLQAGSGKMGGDRQYDHGRIDFHGFGFLSPDAIENVNLRDFNEDLQQARELSRVSFQDRIERDRRLQRVYSEFVDAAIQGAMNVVDGNLTPMNPYDPKRTRMFLYNNIFFSFAMDGREVFARLGGDEAARVSSGKDLAANRAWNKVDPEGIYMPAMVIVDYRGHRVVAQSMVPGILRPTAETESPVVYGYQDENKTIRVDPEFRQRLTPVAKQLHIVEHAVRDQNGNEVYVNVSPECKGLLAGDGRRYVIELYRTTPVDILFREQVERDGIAYPHQFTVLRTELVEQFHDHKYREYLTKLSDENKKKKGAVDGDEAATDTLYLDGIDEDQLEFTLALNPDVFTGNAVTGDTIEQDENLVRDASNYLRTVAIPGLVSDWYLLSSLPSDSDSLCTMLHRRGINMRYLGALVQYAQELDVKIGKEMKRSEIVLDICAQEMVVRAAKHILREWMQTCEESQQVASVVAHFLDCLLAGGSAIRAEPDSCLSYDADRLWDRIVVEVKRRFCFDLPEEFQLRTKNAKTRLRLVALLRSLCLQCGIQLQARDYFGAEPVVEIKPAVPAKKANKKNNGKPIANAVDSAAELFAKLNASAATTGTFQPCDIVCMVPVTKTASFRSRVADETFLTAKMTLNQSSTTENADGEDAEASGKMGLDLLVDALSLHETIYGPGHKETGAVASHLALALFHRGEVDRAIELQTQALNIMEQSSTFDGPDTINQYLNLAYFYYTKKDLVVALKCMRHALRCWHVSFGDGHPDEAVANANVSLMLESVQDLTSARWFMERTLALNETHHGKDHIQTATSLHALAKLHGMEGEYKLALGLEKKAYLVYERVHGKDHARTAELDKWLQQWTKLAVEVAKRSQEVQKQSNGIEQEVVVPVGSAAKVKKNKRKSKK